MRNTSLINLALWAIMAGLALSASAQAQSGNPPTTTKGDDKKLDVSDLENKYWAPKDTDFSVVQNRTYSKEKRWFFTPQYGILVNDAYSTGSIFGLTGNYFFSERYGLQLSYQKASLNNTAVIANLQTQYSTGVYPNHDKLDSFYGVGFSYVPFYAKMSFMGQKIIYFDMAITPIVGETSYQQAMAGGNATKSAFSYGIDITQYFFFTNWFAIRADLDNHWTSENIVGYANDAPTHTMQGQPISTKSNLDTTFLIGLTFYY